MKNKRYVIMGAGEVGRYLARSLSADGHAITLIDPDPEKQRLVDEQLDVGFVRGNGSHVPTLQAAGVGECSLFVAASSSDEANLAASLLAKRLGANRTVVRLATTEDVTRYRKIYEQSFQADLLLSTQLLTTTRVLNYVLGHNTLEIEYVAGGELQLRRISVAEGSVLADRPLSEAKLPKDCLVLAYTGDGGVVVPSGSDLARVGDEALVIGTREALDDFEHRVSRYTRRLGLVVIAGGGTTAAAVVAGLENQAARIKILEKRRPRAEELAAEFPDVDVIHADATDMTILASEGVDDAHTFIALTGNDETNLMACLLAQELGARNLTALVQTRETSTLWRKIALLDIVSPRTIAAQRIRSYIDSDFAPHIVSSETDGAIFLHRYVEKESAVAGGTLESVQIPQGLIVAAVLRDDRAMIPGGSDKLEVGDEVFLFVRQQELPVAQLFFPGPDLDAT